MISPVIEIEPSIFAGLSREIFDGRDEVEYSDVALPGISEALVRQISAA